MTPASYRLVVLLGSFAACARGDLRRGGEQQAGPLVDAGQPRCSVVKDPDKPLIVEWSGMDAAELEARLLRGLVAVRYERDTCEMEVLTRCAGPGQYAFAPTTTHTETLHISTLAELFLDLPLGVDRLADRVERGEAFDLEMVVVGRYEAPRPAYSATELSGTDCQLATHVVMGVSLGAFRLSSTQSDGRGDLGPGVAGGSTRASSVWKESPPDMLAACAAVSGVDDPRRKACSAPLRLEVAPLGLPAPAIASAPASAGAGDVGAVGPAAAPGDVTAVVPGDAAAASDAAPGDAPVDGSLTPAWASWYVPSWKKPLPPLPEHVEPLPAHLQGYLEASGHGPATQKTARGRADAWCVVTELSGFKDEHARAQCRTFVEYDLAVYDKEAKLESDYDALDRLLDDGVSLAEKRRAVAEFLALHGEEPLGRADLVRKVEAIQRDLLADRRTRFQKWRDRRRGR